jgi:hypothetical protein
VEITQQFVRKKTKNKAACKSDDHCLPKRAPAKFLLTESYFPNIRREHKVLCVDGALFFKILPRAVYRFYGSDSGLVQDEWAREQ